MKLCACGCGEAVLNDTATYLRGHHWKVARKADGVPDEKTCERCGRTYSRTEIGGRQSNKHWMRRRFCCYECADAARELDPEASTKYCRRCGEMKPREAFQRDGRTGDGLQTNCADCKRDQKKPLSKEKARQANHRAFYRLKPGEYDRMLAAQDGVCAICREPERAVSYRTGRPFALAVDHCHDTLKVRGLLCSACNLTLGKMRNRPDVFRAAAEYLERHERDYQQLRLQGES